MLFLCLENQLFLIIVLVFSTLILASAFIIRPQTTALRVFELAFAIPLFLTVTAFLDSPYLKSKAEHLMILGQLFLVLFCTAVILIKPPSKLLKCFTILPFVLIGAALFSAGAFFYKNLLIGFCIINFFLMLLNLTLVIHSLLEKEKNRIKAYLGLFMLTVFIGLWLLLGELSIESVLLMVLGYGLCASYIYQNS